MAYSTANHLQCGSYCSIRYDHKAQSTATYAGKGKRVRKWSVAAFLLICFGIAVLVSAWSGNGKVQAGKAASYEQITVLHGDSLWSISSKRVQRDEDIRSYIYKLKKLNGLESSALQAGQLLLLP